MIAQMEESLSLRFTDMQGLAIDNIARPLQFAAGEQFKSAFADARSVVEAAGLDYAHSVQKLIGTAAGAYFRDTIERTIARPLANTIDSVRAQVFQGVTAQIGESIQATIALNRQRMAAEFGVLRDLNIRIPAGYPAHNPDMFFIAQAMQCADGTAPTAVTTTTADCQPWCYSFSIRPAR